MSQPWIRFAFLLSCSATIVAAAPDNATITGAVSDPSGAAVNGAIVNLHQVAGSTLLSAVSDNSGHFQFTDVTPGEYLLDASTHNLNIPQPLRLTLAPGQTTNLDVKLVVSATTSQVSVTAADEPQSVDQISKALDIVNADDAERRGIISIPDALAFVPGLRVSTRGSPGQFTTIQTRGLRVQDTDILIDGYPFRDVTSVQDEASAYIGEMLLVDTSRIEVLRGSGSSLYGTNSMSGTVNIITDPGGGSTHGDVDLQGGGLGLFRGLVDLSGSTFHNKFAYSAGISHLNVTEGLEDMEAARDWSGQGSVSYALTPNIRLGADIFANTGYLEDPVSPAATPGLTQTGIVRAIPLPFAQAQLLAANLPYNPGNSNFWPQLADSDSGIYSHFVFALFRFEHQVKSRFSYRAAYEFTDTHRNNTNGPAGPNNANNFEPTFNTSELYNGRLDTARARADYLLGSHQILTAGYELQREQYLNVNSDQNPDPTQRLYNNTSAVQDFNAVFAQDQIRLLDGRLDILLSGRYTRVDIDEPAFVGGASPYAGLPLPPPPSAYTGDASIAYYVSQTSTKLRAHVGNSFRMPSLYERFGGYFFGGSYIPIGNPELAPERAISLDGGFDQYFLHDRLKISGTYFYTHLQEEIDYLDFPPGYVDPYGRTSGYYDTRGGISRGVELSGDFHPARNTSLFASYTYTNAKDLVSEYYTGTAFDPLQMPRILPQAFSIVATQQIGKHLDVAMDFDGGSSYLYPLYGVEPASGFAYPYAYRFQGPRQLGLSAGYTVPFRERMRARFYVRVSNALNQNFYEDGFLTPNRWAVGGIHFAF